MSMFPIPRYFPSVNLRYIDMGLLDVRNIDLQRKVRFRTKKEYDYSREKIDHEYRFGRQYHDFQDYMELHPMASIVEMDTVIGTTGGKGGKCFLTLFPGCLLTTSLRLKLQKREVTMKFNAIYFVIFV